MIRVQCIAAIINMMASIRIGGGRITPSEGVATHMMNQAIHHPEIIAALDGLHPNPIIFCCPWCVITNVMDMHVIDNNVMCRLSRDNKRI